MVETFLNKYHFKISRIKLNLGKITHTPSKLKTMAYLDFLNLTFLVTSLFSSSNISSENNSGAALSVSPPTCSRIECPSYDVIHSGKGFEIRRYNSSMWVSTQPIEDVSFVDSGRIGFLQLFAYIQGKNDNQQKIEMTAPVITEVGPSDGPFCASSFVVSFYVPKENQATAPSAKALRLRKWGTTYVAVRQFGGFVMDDDLGEQADALYASIAGTSWADAVDRSRKGDNGTEYIVAQYNSPFEFRGRVNEIWLTFEMDDGLIEEARTM